MCDGEMEKIKDAGSDPEMLGRLYDRYFPKVYAYVSYRVGRVQDVEDIVGDVFTRAAQGIAQFEWRHEASFEAWLFRIAHNLVSDFHRHRSRWQDPLPLEEAPDMASDALLPDEVMLQKEKFAYLRGLILTLPPRQQEVIGLRFFGGLTNRAIAQVLGINERTVATHLCRGLEELHRRYVEDFVRPMETEAAKERTPSERVQRSEHA